MKSLKALFSLFYPRLCAICEAPLLEAEPVICSLCRHDLPLTEITNLSDNKVFHTFYGKVVIQQAYAFLWFRKNGPVQKMIHALKYQSNEDIGVFFGDWVGHWLAQHDYFTEVDCIVPVPLHRKRKRERGYNQVAKFSTKISQHLQITYEENMLLRVSSTITQTFKSRLERFRNVGTKFMVNPKVSAKYHHILLIDDVVTTGATLEACAKVLKEQTGCKISILALAYTE